MSVPPHSSEATRAVGQRRHSISAKIVFLVFLCTFSTAAVISAIVVRTQHAQIHAKIEDGFPAVLERTGTALQVWLAEGTTALQTLASSPRSRSRFAALAARPGRERARSARAELAEFASRSIHFDAAGLLAQDGTWLAATPELADAGPVEVDLDAERYEQPAVAPGSRAGALLVVPVVRGDPGSGFLAGRLDRHLLERLLEEERHEVGAAVALTDATGRMLAGIDGPAGPLPSLEHSLARLRVEEPGTVHEYASRDAVHTLGAARSLDPGAPADETWWLVVEAPFASAFGALIDVLTRVFAVDLLLCLAFIGAAYRITTRMLRPIADLAEAARLASTGNLGQAIADPGTHDEIGRLTRSFNDMMGKLHQSQSDLREANRELTTRNDELQRANEVLSQLSITDGLTKLHNHRHFQECLTREIKRQSRTEKPLSMLLVDLDDFKSLNDRLGHASGDELLVRVASILDSTVRESDLLARYGGEEFVVLATDTDLEGAVAVAEKIRMNIEQAPHIVNESLRPIRITVSIGVAQYAGNRRRFFEAADRALYRAKDQGKNCVVAASESGTLD